MDPMGEVLYVSDTSSRRVYRVRNLGQPKDPSRNLEVVAGTGEQCLPFDQNHCGEGRKAIEAALNNPRGRRLKTLHLKKGSATALCCYEDELHVACPQANIERCLISTQICFESLLVHLAGRQLYLVHWRSVGLSWHSSLNMTYSVI